MSFWDFMKGTAEFVDNPVSTAVGWVAGAAGGGDDTTEEPVEPAPYGAWMQGEIQRNQGISNDMRTWMWDTYGPPDSEPIEVEIEAPRHASEGDEPGSSPTFE